MEPQSHFISFERETGTRTDKLHFGFGQDFMLLLLAIKLRTKDLAKIN